MTVPYSKLFARFESILESHGGRPHWAKAHRAGPDQLRKMYPRFDDFLELRKRVDPEGRFLNPYTRRSCVYAGFVSADTRSLLGESGQAMARNRFLKPEATD